MSTILTHTEHQEALAWFAVELAKQERVATAPNRLAAMSQRMRDGYYFTDLPR